VLILLIVILFEYQLLGVIMRSRFFRSGLLMSRFVYTQAEVN